MLVLLNLLILILLSYINKIHCEILIIQLENNISFESFELKYNALLTNSKFKYFKFGDIKLIISDFNVNFQKSIYFDKSISSISSNLDLSICDLNLVQNFAPKHLVRLSQLNPIKKHQKMNFNFKLSKNPINIYILDTGINNNNDFTNRIVFKNQLIDDLNGHGTAIASLVGSELLGTCKNCNLISYQILNHLGFGKLNNLINSLSLIYENEKKGVLLLPFITSKSKVLNNILHELRLSNFTIVAPAGNFGENSCNFSPSSSIDVLTIGSIDSNTNTIAQFSNYGPCINFFTDGINVLALSNIENEFTLKSGTSLSAAIAAGLVSTILGSHDSIDGNSINDSIQMLNNLAIEDKIESIEFLKTTKTTNKILHI